MSSSTEPRRETRARRSRELGRLEFEASLAASRAGDRVAEGDLLSYFLPELLAMARRRLSSAFRSKFDDWDLVQEALLLAHRDLGEFQGGTASEFRIWLRAIMVHVAISWSREYLRREKRDVRRERRIEDAAGAAAPTSPPEDPDVAAAACSEFPVGPAAVQAALNRLAEVEKTVLLCHLTGRLAFREIGQEIGRTPEATRKLCSRALLRLRHAFGA